MSLEILLFFVGFFIGAGLIWVIRGKEFESVKNNRDEIKQAFGDLSNEVLVESQKTFLDLAEHKFSTLLENSDEQLDKKKDLIDSSLKDMRDRLKNLSENTVALKSQMEESRKSVGDLSDTTSKLRQILSSSQARGQWGREW